MLMRERVRLGVRGGAWEGDLGVVGERGGGLLSLPVALLEGRGVGFVFGGW